MNKKASLKNMEPIPASICNLGSCKFYLWRGQIPYKVTFKILLEKDEPTLVSGADCLQLGLIKCLGSVNTTKDNSKKKKSTNVT